MDKQKDFELIGRFLDFDLVGEELEQFEKRMEEDPILQERFKLFQEMDKHVDQAFPPIDIKEVKKGMQAELQSQRTPKSAKIRKLPILRIASIAAGVAVLLIAGFFWINQSTAVRTNQAIAAHYWENTDKAHLFDSLERSEGNPADPEVKARAFFRNLQDLYESGQYPIVIDQLEIYKATTPTPIPFEGDANWLLAIAYLANNDAPRATEQLNDVATRFPDQKTRVAALLKVLKAMQKEGSVRLE